MMLTLMNKLGKSMNLLKCCVVLGILLVCIMSCRSQYSPYDELLFKEVTLCQGLDNQGTPIAKVKTVASDADRLYLCIYLETRTEVTFTVRWFGPDFFRRTIVKVEKSGWFSTWLTSNGKDFPTGEYTVEIYVGRTLKATNAFEVVQGN